MPDQGWEHWADALQQSLERIENNTTRAFDAINSVKEEMHTKKDMERFVRDTCAPSRLEVSKLGLFKAKFIGIIIGIQTVFALLITFHSKITSFIVSK